MVNGRPDRPKTVGKARFWIGIGLAVPVLLLAAGLATGRGGSPLHSSQDGVPSSGGLSEAVAGDIDGNPHHDTIPCTGPEEPVNFEVFSAGPTPAGLPLTGTSRRCDADVPPQGWPNNYVNYSYGDCEIPEGATGCYPPLQVQTWPACQRARTEYTFEGKPLKYRKLSESGEAEVVEFTFPADRVEVYTETATVVIFAANRDLARRAVHLLRPQSEGAKPASEGGDLDGPISDRLPPPVDGATSGKLRC